MNKHLIQKLRYSIIAVEIPRNITDEEKKQLTILAKTINQVFNPSGNSQFYWVNKDGDTETFVGVPSLKYANGINKSIPLSKFFEDEKDKYSLKSVFDEARKVVSKEEGKYHSKKYTELLERIKTKERKQPEIEPIIIEHGNPLAEIPTIINKPMQWATLKIDDSKANIDFVNYCLANKQRLLLLKDIEEAIKEEGIFNVYSVIGEILSEFNNKGSVEMGFITEKIYNRYYKQLHLLQ